MGNLFSAPDPPHRKSSSSFMSPSPLTPQTPTVKLSSSFEILPPDMSELNVVLLGNSSMQEAADFIMSASKSRSVEKHGDCWRVRGQLKETKIHLLLPNISEDTLMRDVDRCSILCNPGPRVFLLVLQPEDFTEDHRLQLCRVLKEFGDESFDRSLILISTPREEKPGFMEQYRQHPPLKDMIRVCKYRFLWWKDLELPELLTRFRQIVKENQREEDEPFHRFFRRPARAHDSDSGTESEVEFF